MRPVAWNELLPTNCFSVFDHFVRLALKGLTKSKLQEGLLLSNDTSISNFYIYEGRNNFIELIRSSGF